MADTTADATTPMPVRQALTDASGLLSREWQKWFDTIAPTSQTVLLTGDVIQSGGGGTGTGGGGTDSFAAIQPVLASAVLATDGTATPRWIAGLPFSYLTGAITYPQLPAGIGTWVGVPTITGTLTVGGQLLPTLGYNSNIGSLDKKWLSIYGAELWVETLVAQSTTATIGGRVLVAPTNTLTSPLFANDPTMLVKYNNLRVGDRVRLEAAGKVEWMAITAGPTGAGPYTYTITRNLDGTGGNDWAAGDAVLDTGTTGNGFIDLYSTAGVFSGSGPTIVGNVRTGTLFSAIETRWAIGNLKGLYGYPGAAIDPDVYGSAFGDPLKAWVKIDATNGVRLGYGGTTTVQISAAGASTFESGITIGAAGSVTAGGVVFDASGLFINPVSASGGGVYANTNAVRWTTDLVNRTAIWRSDNSGATSERVWNFDHVCPGPNVLARMRFLTQQSSVVSGFGSAQWQTRCQGTGADMQLWTGTNSGPDSFLWMGSITGPSSGAHVVLGVGSASNMIFSFNAPPTIFAGVDVIATGVTVVGGVNLTCNAIVRAKGGYGGGGGGLALEIATVGGQGFVQTYDRDASTFGATTLQSSGVTLQVNPSGNIFITATQVHFGGATLYYPVTVYAGNPSSTPGIGQYSWAADTDTYIDNDSPNRIRVVCGGAAQFYVDTNQMFPARDAVQDLGFSSIRWRTVYASAGVNTSDARLKEHIVDTAYGGDFLRALRPVDFQWKNKETGGGVYQGFLASDVAAIAPECGAVYRDPDGVANGLNYCGLIAPLVRGWQDHEDRLDALERRMTRLRQELA